METATQTQTRRWPLFLVGIVIFLLGPISVIIEMNLRSLRMPWHLPILATVGVLFMLLSATQRGGAVRWIGLGLFALLCGFEWYFVAFVTRLPEYGGTATVGRSIPEFETKLSDGKSFTDKTLKGGPALLVFFRGHW